MASTIILSTLISNSRAKVAKRIAPKFIRTLIHKQINEISTNSLRTRHHFICNADVARTYSSWISHIKNVKYFSTMRQNAILEEFIFSHIGDNVEEPILKIPMKDLNWIHGPYIQSDSNTIQFILRLPTQLHPELHLLKERIKVSTEEAIQLFHDKNKQFKNTSDSDTNMNSQMDVQIQVQLLPPKIKTEKGESLEEREKKLGPGLMNVSSFVAVYSCKGGVGKSTVAANLAYALARKGGRVGLLDVDVYGPSLPILIHPTDPTVRRSSLGSGMVLPISHEGVKLLSLGFVSPKSGVPGSGGNNGSGAAVIRGPMASRVVTQLLKGTEWGELDVLILDLPPGTGDVQLTLCQDLQLNGAISVTTPSKLAIADAVKGIEMFNSLGVPTLATVENMAFFQCEGGGKHYPFGRSAYEKLIQADDSESINNIPIFQLPISEPTNSSNDSGTPITLSRPAHAQIELDTFDKIAENVASSILLQQYDRYNVYDPSLDDTTSQYPTIEINGKEWEVSSLQLSAHPSDSKFSVRLYSDTGALELEINGEDLRMTHPKTGMRLEDSPSKEDELRPKRNASCGNSSNQMENKKGIVEHHIHGNQNKKQSQRNNIFPVEIQKKGFYGYSVSWADGATIIYSMSSIAKASANYS